MAKVQPQQFVVCLRNEGYEVSLEKLKIYAVVADAEAEHAGMLRVIDESGADYLYPGDLFETIELSPEIGKAVLAA